MNAYRKRLERLAGAWSHLSLLFAVFFLFSCTAKAGTFHVDAAVAASGDGLTWATAMKTIQEGIDAASDGDAVVVTNGVYAVGGAVTPSYSAANRLCITNAISVCSVNGPDVTVIVGAQGSNGGNDTDSVRGVFMNNGGTLCGFTISNGYTMATGNVDYDQAGGGVWLTDGCVVSNCVVVGNHAKDDAGGAYLYYGGTLNNCVLKGNWASAGCGGALLWYGGTLNNCLLMDNHAVGDGGGVYLATGGVLNNCTLTGNSGNYGGGAYIYSSGELNNCIVWGNTAALAGTDIRKNGGGTTRYTCASDGLSAGTDGCITSDPGFVSTANEDFSLQAASPCRDTGSNLYAPTNVTPFDLAWNPRIVGGTVDMGSYEWQAPPLPKTVYVDASRPDDSGAGTSWGTAKKTIQAAVDLTIAGDTVLVTNGTYNTGGAIAPDFNNLGTLESYTMTNRVCAYGPITIASVNGPDVTIIEGAPGSNGSNDVDSVRGVYLNNGATLNGFTVTNGYTVETWSSMDGMGGGIWAGTNSVATNCIISGCLANNIGGGAYMYFGGTLNNCTLDGNRARGDSGGAHAGTLNDCTISNNSANNSGGVQSSVMNRCIISGNSSQNSGGGVSGGTLSNCLIIQNSSENGGGVIYATLINCTVSGNTATRYGGGTSNSELYNSISWGNTAGTAGNDCWFGNGFGKNSCASDGVTAGVDGCITANPLFADAGADNYRLTHTSPCIDTGNNTNAPMPYDLEGTNRIMGGSVDMGAYESEVYISTRLPDPNPDPLAFGNVEMNQSTTLSFRISNTGNSTLTVTGLDMPAGFSGSWTGTVAAAGQSPDINVTFAPTSATSYSGDITINSDATGGDSTVRVTGTGTLPPTYTVSYNANGATSGTVPVSQTKTNNVTLTLRTNSGNLAKTDYTFAGWNTTANGSGTSYASGGSYTANATVTLFAKWSVVSRSWDDSYEDIGGGWRRLSWFGDYVPMGEAGWIWHNKHGFFFVPANATPESIWLYSQDMGWLYTSNAAYPFLYRANDLTWLWYNGSTNPRWFVNMGTGQWESHY